LSEPRKRAVNRALCGARTRSGTPCRRPAGWATQHTGYGACKLHGGSTPNAGKAAAKLEAAHKADVLRQQLGVPAEADPLKELVHCLAIAAGEVEYCSHMLALLSTAEELTLPVPSANAQSWIYARHHATERMARLAKMAIDAGVADRQVANAERLGDAVGSLLRGVLDDLNLTPEQQDAARGRSHTSDAPRRHHHRNTARAALTGSAPHRCAVMACALSGECLGAAALAFHHQVKTRPRNQFAGPTVSRKADASSAAVLVRRVA
jgi:hypothetical protein